jgi:3-oxoadipate enol-lactonase
MSLTPPSSAGCVGEDDVSDNGSHPGVYWPKDRSVRAPDGAEIAYTFLGPQDGPVVALCAGFLCPDTWWYHLAPALATEGHRVLLFHYRGVGTSGLPHPRAEGAFTMERFAGDLAAIVAAEGIDRLSLLGHSMGVQVMLEAYRLLRDRADLPALVAITGQYSSPLRSLYDRPQLAAVLYEPLRLGLRLVVPPVRQAVWRSALRLPALRFGQLISAFGPRTDATIIDAYLRHLARRDVGMIMRVVEGMHAHSAADLLPQIAAPTLVLMGGRDPFSPPSQGRLMAGAIPTAVTRTVPLGTHGLILEYPEQVNGYVLDFLARHAPAVSPRYCPSAGSKSIAE